MDIQDAIEIRGGMNQPGIFKSNVKLIDSAQKSRRYLLNPSALMEYVVSKQQYITKGTDRKRFLRNEDLRFKSFIANNSRGSGIAR